MSDADYLIGASPARLEDERFLRGQGHYLDDLRVAGAAHAVVVRSPHAHARILTIDTDRSTAVPGVLDVLTAKQAADDGLGQLWPSVRQNPHDGKAFAFQPQPLLATERVRYVGEPIALVVAASYHAALDAAEALTVHYDPLPAVCTVEEALAQGAPEVSPDVPGNRCLQTRIGEPGRVSAAFATAAHVISMSTVNHRVITNSMEPRGAIGHFDPAAERYHLIASSQNVHVIRDQLAEVLGVAADRVRVSAPDVGGGFGNRNFIYPEYALALWAARRMGRPVKWANSRTEGFCSDHQARDLSAEASLALDQDGTFLALRIASTANLGAYVAGAACGVQTFQYTTAPGGLYDIPALDLEIAAVVTNTVPVGVTRGPGFAEAVNVVERLIDVAARQCGFDRIALRRRNLVRPERLPWTNVTGTRIDSGDFPGCLERALHRSDYPGFAARREAALARGQWLGFGLACHVKATGGLPEENVALCFERDRLVFTTGTMAIGQGHETSFRQILATLLGLDPGRVTYRAGDSDLIAMGGGHGSSRATYMASTAMARAAAAVVAGGRQALAESFGVPVQAVSFTAGAFAIAGANREIPLLEAALMAREAGRDLDTYQHVVREAMTFPNGCHAAEIAIDPDTGVTRLMAYTAVDDYGVEVNPRLVQGQMHGAIAQGAGQALLETAVYEDGTGQLLSGSFMDYALPRADDLPEFTTATHGVPCSTNPLGVKGCGEAGAVAGFPAIGNAVADALDRVGARHRLGPASPERIWRQIHGI